MRLTIEPTIHLTTLKLLEKKGIPCYFKVSKNLFELHFQTPLPDIAVKISNWSLERIRERCQGNVGGEYLYFFSGQITLKK